MSAPWAVTPEKIESAIQRIVQVRQPRQVILFGSAVHGELHLRSDVDFLVVTGEETIKSREESVQLRRALRGISMPMDILVISEKRLKELAPQPGLIFRDALRNGKVVYEAPE